MKLQGKKHFDNGNIKIIRDVLYTITSYHPEQQGRKLIAIQNSTHGK